jgi:hypothetical protein
MKRHVIAAAVVSTLALAQNQHVLDIEYQLNQPGMPAAQAQAAQNQAPMVPVYGSCDADRSVIAYLQDQVQNGNLDAGSAYVDRRNIYDLQVNLRQRGC